MEQNCQTIARLLDISLFNNFRVLVEILVGPLLLPEFNEEIKLKISVLSLGVIKNDSVFKAEGNQCIFSWKV